MYTAEDARKSDQSDLDQRIAFAVRARARDGGAYLRVYIEDPWCRTIQQELEQRGFKNINVPDICLKGDVYFEW